MSEEFEFDLDRATWVPQLADHIIKWYGERHLDRCPYCTNCAMWEAYDVLVRNPFREEVKSGE